MKPTALHIAKDVAEEFGVTLEDLRSRSRVARIADARAVAFFLLTRYLHMSTGEAGKFLRRDHATVMHGARKVEGMFQWPKFYASEIEIIDHLKQKYFAT